MSAQALVIEVVLLFQSNTDLALTAQGLKKSFWLGLFTSVFSKMPFLTRTATVTVQVPTSKPSTIISGLTEEPQTGFELRYKVTENNSEVYGRYHKDNKLVLDVADFQKSLASASSLLPFGGSLKLILLSCHLKNIRVEQVKKFESALTSIAANRVTTESNDD